MEKCAMYFIENQKIEVISTFYGKEMVLLNGVQVSEKSPGVKASHIFTIGENEYTISQGGCGAKKQGNGFVICKNGEAISLVNFMPQTSTQLFIFMVLTGFGFIFILSFLLYRFL